jgi:hypothetical protein
VSSILVSALLAVAVPAAKIVAPIIAALGCATLTAVFKIFLHGGLVTVDWMVQLGRDTKAAQTLAESGKTFIEQAEILARALLAAALKSGKRAVIDEAEFAAMVLLQEYRKVAAVTKTQLGVAP